MIDEEGLPLQGVLLSLSGGKFRSNNLTQASGSLVFTGLGADQYYLRALMKEYKFEPGSQVRYSFKIKERSIWSKLRGVWTVTSSVL